MNQWLVWIAIASQVGAISTEGLMHIQKSKLINRTSAAQQRAEGRFPSAVTMLRSKRLAALIHGYERKIETLTSGLITRLT